MANFKKVKPCKFCNQPFAKSLILSTIGGEPFPKIVIPVTLIPNKKWYFKKTSRSPSTIKEFDYASKIMEYMQKMRLR